MDLVSDPRASGRSTSRPNGSAPIPRSYPVDRDLPGASLFDIVRGKVMCEYHAAGAATGAFMIRRGRFKYVH
jgi:hypothetical protein